jgi:2-amino-4-hydroxy-6-hydroxymethyldihydropteridine diphosphokinase
VDIRLGFKVPTKVNLYFHEIVNELMEEKQVDLVSKYPSLHEYKILSDFRYIVIERVPNKDFDFENIQKIVMNLFFFIRKIGLTDVKYYGLDSTSVSVEEVPLLARSEIIINESDSSFVDQISDEKKIKISDLKFTRIDNQTEGTENRYIILISSNHGAFHNIEKAKGYLLEKFDKILFSENIKSDAVGNGVGFYMNSVGIVETEIGLQEIQQFLKYLETAMGRERGTQAKGKVKIDLDLVEWNGKVLRPIDAEQPYYKNCIESLKDNAHQLRKRNIIYY